jgi:hypothetical protein
VDIDGWKPIVVKLHNGTHLKTVIREFNPLEFVLAIEARSGKVFWTDEDARK